MRWSWGLSLIVTCGLIAAGPRGLAADPLPATLPPPPAPPTSVEVLAHQLVAALTEPPPGVRARGPEARGGPGDARPATPSLAHRSFAIRIRFDKPPEGARPDALTAHLGDALEAVVRARHTPGPRVAADAEADERLEIELQVQLGHLAATARRRVLPRSVWEGLLDPEGVVVATGFSSVPIDLQVRTLLGLGRRDVKLGELRVVPVGKKSLGALAVAPILDLAIGDFDGDLHPEVAVLQPEIVRFVRWARGGFSEELGVFSLRGLPAASARVRAPLGRLVPVVRADGRLALVVASSERAEPVAVAWGGAGPERVATLFQKGWPLYMTGVDRFLVGSWPAGQDVLAGGVTEARFGTAGAQWLGSLGDVHDVRAYPHRDGGGGFAPVVAAALVGGELLVTGAGGGGPRSARVPDAGTVAVWVDYDADGALEVLTTSTTLAGPDRLTLSAGAGKPPRWVGLTPQPVTAGTAGDVDRDGFDEVVLATWSGVAGDVLVVVPPVQPGGGR